MKYLFNQLLYNFLIFLLGVFVLGYFPIFILLSLFSSDADFCESIEKFRNNLAKYN